MARPKDPDIVAFVNRQFEEYRSSAFFANWRLLCENIRDAVDQRWRPGEQMTRTGLYIAALRASRDGFREGFTETFMQADPLFLYRPRRNVPAELTDRVQELMQNTWQDCDGLTRWLGQIDDAIDYSMGVAYTHWSRASGMAERPMVQKQAWGDALNWTEDFDIFLDQAEFMRIHPFNYACDPRNGQDLDWEGCEWEWGLPDLIEMAENNLYNKAAVKRIIEKIQKKETSTQSDTYYNVAQKLGGQKPAEGKVYGREYWGIMRDVPGMESDPNEYCLIVCEDEVLRWNFNPVRGRKSWRPFKRTRLCPLNDIPIGLHILAPTLTHQRFKNLLLNLSVDDVIMRQHLGLAVWPNALKNPNDLLNPEGARGVLFMKDSANQNNMPKFFADNRSGLLQDVFQLDDRIERDAQMAGLPNQSLGMNTGGDQNKTATGQRILATNASRRSRAAIMWSIKTGLEPIGKDLMLLTLRNKPPEDLRMTDAELVQVWDNNYWVSTDPVMFDQAAANMSLANAAQVGLQYMTKIAPQDGGADHVALFMRDLFRSYGIPGYKVDQYLPLARPAAIESAQQPTAPAQAQIPPEETANEPEEIPEDINADMALA